MDTDKVLIVEGLFGRWFIQRFGFPLYGWSGSRWVTQVNGVGIGDAQVSNFESIADATLEANRFGL